MLNKTATDFAGLTYNQCAGCGCWFTTTILVCNTCLFWDNVQFFSEQWGVKYQPTFIALRDIQEIYRITIPWVVMV